jgi:hypothetical protein
MENKKTEEKLMAEAASEATPVTKEIISIDPATLNIGMRGVDKKDVRPPQVLLVQKSSDQDTFTCSDGTKPKVGQFFHTGKFEAMETIDCYIINAYKNQYTDKNKEGNPVRDQYVATCMLKSDLSLFMIRFRSSALYALSSLFTAVISQKLPMYNFNVTIETKELSGDKGKWSVPVVRVKQPETDKTILEEVGLMAVQFDQNSSVIMEEEDETIPLSASDSSVKPNADVAF